MARYHINPKTGRPNICRAQTPERCEYAKDGQIPEHYDTKNDALKAYVDSMNDKIVGTYSSRDAADNARLDSLRAFRNLTRGGLWYNSFSREDGKDLLRAADDNDTQAFDAIVQRNARRVKKEAGTTDRAKDPEFQKNLFMALRDNRSGDGMLASSDSGRKVIGIARALIDRCESDWWVEDGDYLADEYGEGIAESYVNGNDRDMAYDTFLLAGHTRDDIEVEPGFKDSQESYDFASEKYREARELLIAFRGKDFVNEIEEDKGWEL